MRPPVPAEPGPEAAAPDASSGGGETRGGGAGLRADDGPGAPGPSDDVEPASGGLHGWLARIPLRARLVVITTFLLAAGLVATGLVAREVTERHLIGQVDAELRATIPEISKLTLPYERGNLPSNYYVEYRFAEGTTKVVRTERTVTEFGIPSIPGLTGEQVAALKGPFTVPASVIPGSDASVDATQWRVYPLLKRDEQGAVSGMVFVALPLTNIDRTLEILTRTLVLAGLGIVLLGLVLAWLMIERSLRQLRAIETAAAHIAAGDLSQRVPAPPPSTEVGSLAESLNSMLTQIESSFAVRGASEARMRQFVSDASHELRTPLATIRGYGELYRMGALDGPDGPDGARVADTMNRVEDAARRMGTLVNDLLTLARLDEGRPIVHGPVDVVALARDSAQDLHALDPSREVRVVGLSGGDDGADGTADEAATADAGGPEGAAGPEGAPGIRPHAGGGPDVAGPVTADGDADRLRQVLTNLIGNVARHTPAGSPAEIAVGHGPDGEVVVEVRDHGQGVSAEQAARMFERFYRADSSRNRESGGSGLGLAIVSAIVEAHRGRIAVGSTDGGGLTVRVTLPPTVPEEM